MSNLTVLSPNEFESPKPPVPQSHHVHSVEYMTTDTGEIRVITGDRRGTIRVFSTDPWTEVAVLTEHTKAGEFVIIHKSTRK